MHAMQAANSLTLANMHMTNCTTAVVPAALLAMKVLCGGGCTAASHSYSRGADHAAAEPNLHAYAELLPKAQAHTLWRCLHASGAHQLTSTLSCKAKLHT
jgi:hypothetical protein